MTPTNQELSLKFSELFCEAWWHIHLRTLRMIFYVLMPYVSLSLTEPWEQELLSLLTAGMTTSAAIMSIQEESSWEPSLRTRYAWCYSLQVTKDTMTVHKRECGFFLCLRSAPSRSLHNKISDYVRSHTHTLCSPVITTKNSPQEYSVQPTNTAEVILSLSHFSVVMLYRFLKIPTILGEVALETSRSE